MAFLNQVLRFSIVIAVIPIAVALIYKQYPLSTKFVGVQDEDHIDTAIPSLFSMADIHGDFPRALAALVHAGVVDEGGSWKAGNATFVCAKIPAMNEY
jgi:hypothetical protein